MRAVERFVLGGVFALAALLGLGMASRFADGGLHYFGLLLFLVSIGLIFAQIAGVSFGTRNDSRSGLPLPPILRNFARLRARADVVVNGMNAIEKFVTGGVLGVFAIVALFVAARHGEGASYWGGLGVFAVLIGLIFYQISSVKYGADNDSTH